MRRLRYQQLQKRILRKLRKVRQNRSLKQYIKKRQLLKKRSQKVVALGLHSSQCLEHKHQDYLEVKLIRLMKKNLKQRRGINTRKLIRKTRNKLKMLKHQHYQMMPKLLHLYHFLVERLLIILSELQELKIFLDSHQQVQLSLVPPKQVLALYSVSLPQQQDLSLGKLLQQQVLFSENQQLHQSQVLLLAVNLQCHQEVVFFPLEPPSLSLQPPLALQ